jgi:phospholipase C
LIVEGIERANPNLATLPERVLVVRDQNLLHPDASPSTGTPASFRPVVLDGDGDVMNTGTGTGKPAQDLSLNFVPVPYPIYPPSVITMKPSERQLWRVLNASAITYLNLQVLFNGEAQTVGVVALDGVPINESGRSGNYALWQNHLGIPPGGRIEFVVKGPPEGTQASLVTRSVNTGSVGENDPTRPLTTIIVRPEQQAFDSGLMDKFPEFTATVCPASTFSDVSALGAGIVMRYYDGNTVTVISGMTGGVDPAANMDATAAGDVVITAGLGSIVGDSDPFYDDCSGSERAGMLSTNLNIGNSLSTKGISWAWFQGGFTPTTAFVPASGNTPAVPAACATKTNRIDGTPEAAYSAHHNPFQYYASTSNPHHLPPASMTEIGHDGRANHQYDLSLFQKSALANGLPAVTYIKANRAQDGHPSNSSPLDEQVFLVNTINFLQSLPEWDATAVIITWDDSDGWYDHVMPPIVNQSTSTADALTGPGALAALQARCGYGPRIPMLVISPYAKDNFVDHSLTDQSSVVRFIEENWELPQIGNGSFDQVAGSMQNMFDFKDKRTDKVILNPSTGQVVFDK